MKIIVVGGVATGASAVARLRRLNENAQIILFEKGEYISFANCGLPYYIGNVIQERKKLFVTSAELMRERFNIDVRPQSEVIAVSPEENKVRVRNMQGEYEETYDHLILSPGAKPFTPPIEGLNEVPFFTVRNIPDADKIIKTIESQNISKATVIGGGFIGIEMAENLHHRNIRVNLIEATPQLLAPFDSEMAQIAENELTANGITVLTNSIVKGARKKDSGAIALLLNNGTVIETELLIIAAGVQPDTDFIKDSGIALNERGYILVNKNLQTNYKNVFAGGDAVETFNFINGANVFVPLAGPANKHGRMIADFIAGNTTEYDGVQATAVIKLFSMTAAVTGVNERMLQQSGTPYHAIYLHPNSHASYYPGATALSMKLLFNNEGKILGAQTLGYEGVEKRMDVIATTMRLSGTVYDLTRLELSYAPPYSSAKDPVNMAGYIAENILTGKSEVVSPKAIAAKNDNVIVLDVRTQQEHKNSPVENTINMPLDTLRNNIGQLDKSKEYWMLCAVGLRGYLSERILKQHGFNVRNISGGYRTYTHFFPKKENQPCMNNTNVSPIANDTVKVVEFDACGLCCPGPLMQVRSEMDKLQHNDVLKIKASDPGFYEDIKAWCTTTGNELLSLEKHNGIAEASIKKSIRVNAANNTSGSQHTNDGKTMIVFSGDLDKAIASFIIANGAVSMGKKVTMFFTFWGLNILRKTEFVKTDKTLIEKMFGWMMPRGSKQLSLSRMNMMGIGTKMIRGIMKSKNIQSLEELIQSAIDSGVHIVACTMSMDVMGIKKEELIDGVQLGGVGYYLGEAENANVNLFI